VGYVVRDGECQGDESENENAENEALIFYFEIQPGWEVPQGQDGRFMKAGKDSGTASDYSGSVGD